MKPIVEIKRVKGYIPVADSKKQVVDTIVYRREGEDTWTTLQVEELPMIIKTPEQ